MNKKSILILLIFLPLCIFAQNQNNHWFFGYNIGLDFSNGNPVFENGNEMKSHESSSIISDENGDLLFYTNGGEGTLLGEYFPGYVWTRDGQIMNNGILNDSLTTHKCFQTSLIVPNPAATNQYYLFTSDYYNEGNKGLKYSLIDMSLDNGNGSVVSKGAQLLDNIKCGLAAYPCSNGIDYWLVTNRKTDYTGTFHVFKITPDSIFLAHTFPEPVSYGSDRIIKFSPDGNYLYCGEVLYHFDNSSGNIDFFYHLDNALDVADFSPNSQLLYATYMGSSAFRLVQFDLTAEDILSSKTFLDENITHGDIKLGPDGKIYVIDLSNDQINCVNNPNIAGIDCNYSLNVIDLNNLDTYFSFPNTLISYNSSSLNFELSNTPNQFLTFPNPFTNIMNIEVDDVFINGNIFLYNNTGQLLLKTTVNGNITKLDFEDFASGIYFVKIINGRNMYTKKIIKR